MSVLVPVMVMELVEALTIFTAAADVVSVPVQLNDVVLVQAVMLLTVAVPELSVTVPHTMRGELCAVLEQVVVVPQVLTEGTWFVSATIPVASGHVQVRALESALIANDPV